MRIINRKLYTYKGSECRPGPDGGNSGFWVIIIIHITAIPHAKLFLQRIIEQHFEYSMAFTKKMPYSSVVIYSYRMDGWRVENAIRK